MNANGTWRCTVDKRRQLALTLLLGISTSVGCKSMPWSSSSEPAAPTVTAPSAGQQRYELLSKEFPQSSAAPGVGGPAPATSDNWFVSGWKKTTAAIAAPFSSSTPVESDDPVSLSTKTGKINPGVYISAAHILESQGKYAEAEAKYQAALKSSPNDLTTLVSLARCYDRQNKTQQALDTYKKAIKAHPKSSIAYNDAGLCYGRQKNTDEAVKHLAKAIELQPTNVRYHNNLATVLVEGGRIDEAYQQLARVNSPAVAHYNVACLLHAHGKTEQATVQLQLALQQDGNLVQARELLASMNVAPPHQDPRIAAMPVSMSSPAAAPYAPYRPQGHVPPAVQQQSVYSGASSPQYPVAAPNQTLPPQATPTAAPQQSFSPWR